MEKYFVAGIGPAWGRDLRLVSFGKLLKISGCSSAGVALRAYAEYIDSITNKVSAYTEYIRSTPDKVYIYTTYML